MDFRCSEEFEIEEKKINIEVNFRILFQQDTRLKNKNKSWNVVDKINLESSLSGEGPNEWEQDFGALQLWQQFKTRPDMVAISTSNFLLVPL